MKVTVEDCLSLLSNCDKCPKEQCYYCRVLWDASIAGRLEDDMYFINCETIQLKWEELKNGKSGIVNAENPAMGGRIRR